MATEGGAASAVALGSSGALNRRQFIGSAAVLAAGAYLLGPNQASDFEEGPLGRLLHQSARLLSVGYVAAGHAAGRGVSAVAEGAKVVPAAAMGRGSRALHGLVTITIHGLTAGLGDPVAEGIQSIYVDALVPAPAGLVDQPALPFYAWTLRAKPRAQSSSSTFSLDLDSKPRLGFAVDVRRVDPAHHAAPARAVFTTGRQADMAKLQPGTYLLGLADGAWDRVRRLPHPADEAAWAGAGLASLIISFARHTA